MGSAAAIALNTDLLQDDVQRAVAAHRRVAEAVGTAVRRAPGSATHSVR